MPCSFCQGLHPYRVCYLTPPHTSPSTEKTYCLTASPGKSHERSCRGAGRIHQTAYDNLVDCDVPWIEGSIMPCSLLRITLRRITTRPGATALDRQRYGEATKDNPQRDSCSAGAKGIDDRGRGVRLQRLQLQRQGVQGTNGLGRPGDFIIRQGKTEQRHPDQTGKHACQHDMAYCLPAAGAKVMRRFLCPGQSRLTA